MPNHKIEIITLKALSLILKYAPPPQENLSYQMHFHDGWYLFLGLS